MFIAGLSFLEDSRMTHVKGHDDTSEHRIVNLCVSICFLHKSSTKEKVHISGKYHDNPDC